MTNGAGRLGEQASRIEQAIEHSAAELEPAVAQQAQDDLAALRQRLALGIDHTVVALVGGTGSGKSSLFNAISGLRFAAVGALRPTTQAAAACVWGSPATALLDFLEIEPSRRIARESELDAQDESELHGLVLLDMPDHDSVEESHSRQVDRLLPLADLLLWVVDPQKYADHALHARYLRDLERRADAMVVLVNQVDTVPPDAVGAIEESLRELLIADGLPHVPIIMTSTATGRGVEDVRERLVDVVSQASMAARTAQAELAAVAQRLAPAVGEAPAELDDDIAATASLDLTRASGLAPVTESMRSAARRLGAGSPPRPELPAHGTVEAVRSRMVHRAQEGLPPRWQRSVEDAVSRASRLQEALDEDLAQVALPTVRLPAPRRTRLAGALLAAIGFLLTLALGAMTILAADLPVPGGLALGVALGMLIVGAAIAVAAQLWLRRDTERLVRDYERRVREVIDDAVATHLLRPAQLVIARHSELRMTLEL